MLSTINQSVNTNQEKIKAWRMHGIGLQNLQLDDIVRPVPGPDQILIRVTSVSLNYRDKAVIEGTYRRQSLPDLLIPVSDAAGIVVAIGRSVSGFKTGDPVVSHLYAHWLEGQAKANEADFSYGNPLPGGLAEYMLLEAVTAVKIPEYLSSAQAATLPIAGLAAWYALITTGRLQKQDTVLIQGTGGVSIFGLQIAHAIGARVIVLTSSPAKAEKLMALGADEVINYKEQPEWAQAVTKLTSGNGVDHLLDIAGGDNLNQSVSALRPGGNLYVVGFLNGTTTHLNLLPVIAKRIRIQGISVGHKAAFMDLIQFIKAHQIKPVIDREYRFEEAVQAFRHLDRGPFGKIVINIASEAPNGTDL